MHFIFFRVFLLAFGLFVAGCNKSPSVVMQNQGVDISRATPGVINPSQVELSPSPLAKYLGQKKEEENVQPEETQHFVANLCSGILPKQQAAIQELNQRLTAVQVQQLQQLHQLLKDKLVDPNCWSFALDAMEKKGNLSDEILSEALVHLAGKINLNKRQETRPVEKQFNPLFNRLLRKVRKTGNPGPGLRKLIKHLKVLVESGNKGPAIVIFVKVIEHVDKELAHNPKIINELADPLAESIQKGILNGEKIPLKVLNLVEAHASPEVQKSVYTRIASGIHEGTMTNKPVAAALLDKVERLEQANKSINQVVEVLAKTIKEKGTVLTDNDFTRRSVELFRKASQDARNTALKLVAQGVESGTVANTDIIAGILGVADTYGRSWNEIALYFARRIGARGQLGNDANAIAALQSIRDHVSQLEVKTQTAQIVAQGVEQGNVTHADTVAELLNNTGAHVPALNAAALPLARRIRATGQLGIAALNANDNPPKPIANAIAFLNSSVNQDFLIPVMPIITDGIADGNVNDDAVAQVFFTALAQAPSGVQIISADALVAAIQKGPGVPGNILNNAILQRSGAYITEQALHPGGAAVPAAADEGRVQAIVDAVVPNLNQGAGNARQDAVMNSMLQPVVPNLTLAMCNQLDKKDSDTLGYIDLNNDKWFRDSYLNMIQDLGNIVNKNAVRTDALFDIMMRHNGPQNDDRSAVFERAKAVLRGSFAAGSLELTTESVAHLVKIMKIGGIGPGNFVAGRPNIPGALDAVKRGLNAGGDRTQYRKLLVKLLEIPNNDYPAGGVPNVNNFNSIRNKLNTEWNRVPGGLGIQSKSSIFSLALNPHPDTPLHAADKALELMGIQRGALNRTAFQDPQYVGDLDPLLKNLVGVALDDMDDSQDWARGVLNPGAVTAPILGEKTTSAIAAKLLTEVDGSLLFLKRVLAGSHGIKIADAQTAANLIKAVGKHGDGPAPNDSNLVKNLFPKALASHPGEPEKALEVLVQALEIQAAAWTGGAGGAGGAPGDPDPTNLPWARITTKLTEDNNQNWNRLTDDQKTRINNAINQDGVALAARQAILDLKIKQALALVMPADGIELVNLSVAHGNLFSRYAEENFKYYLRIFNGNYHIGVGGSFDFIAKVKIVDPILIHVLGNFNNNSVFPTEDVDRITRIGDVSDKRTRILGMFRKTLRNSEKKLQSNGNGDLRTNLDAFSRLYPLFNYNYVTGSIDLTDTTIGLLVKMVGDNHEHANEIVFDYVLPLVMVGGANAKEGIDNMRRLLNALLAHAGARGNLPHFATLRARLTAIRPRDEHLSSNRKFPKQQLPGVPGAWVDNTQGSIANMSVYATTLGVNMGSLQKEYEDYRKMHGDLFFDGSLDEAFPDYHPE